MQPTLAMLQCWFQSFAQAFEHRRQQDVDGSGDDMDEKKAQALTDMANASLTLFEKTYVSFPEFVSNDDCCCNWTPQPTPSTSSSIAC
ncbi:predicted protein [Lichtheimia corymbifera JMRC:FSU:9682]|uniref:Uncharacterized protein n=2 Tax=Lichtheimia TaxID=688353 RepID=A0A068RWR9_9FUNG|nr:uncharacterized protein O0I10_007383 [Lichtheimia ornata]KAJ8656787.1 hypothetical protein O0I10_007383 [Lichtheimia ornata]CDH54027.1 predicted protein [Lichtheimia corymbifera JMRC:FSU:9682]